MVLTTLVRYALQFACLPTPVTHARFALRLLVALLPRLRFTAPCATFYYAVACYATARLRCVPAVTHTRAHCDTLVAAHRLVLVACYAPLPFYTVRSRRIHTLYHAAPTAAYALLLVVYLAYARSASLPLRYAVLVLTVYHGSRYPVVYTLRLPRCLHICSSRFLPLPRFYRTAVALRSTGWLVRFALPPRCGWFTLPHTAFYTFAMRCCTVYACILLPLPHRTGYTFHYGCRSVRITTYGWFCLRSTHRVTLVYATLPRTLPLPYVPHLPFCSFTVTGYYTVAFCSSTWFGLGYAVAHYGYAHLHCRSCVLAPATTAFTLVHAHTFADCHLCHTTIVGLQFRLPYVPVTVHRTHGWLVTFMLDFTHLWILRSAHLVLVCGLHTTVAHTLFVARWLVGLTFGSFVWFWLHTFTFARTLPVSRFFTYGLGSTVYTTTDFGFHRSAGSLVISACSFAFTHRSLHAVHAHTYAFGSCTGLQFTFTHHHHHTTVLHYGLFWLHFAVAYTHVAVRTYCTLVWFRLRLRCGCLTTFGCRSRTRAHTLRLRGWLRYRGSRLPVAAILRFALPATPTHTHGLLCGLRSSRSAGYQLPCRFGSTCRLVCTLIYTFCYVCRYVLWLRFTFAAVVPVWLLVIRLLLVAHYHYHRGYAVLPYGCTHVATTHTHGLPVTVTLHTCVYIYHARVWLRLRGYGYAFTVVTLPAVTTCGYTLPVMPVVRLVVTGLLVRLLRGACIACACGSAFAFAVTATTRAFYHFTGSALFLDTYALPRRLVTGSQFGSTHTVRIRVYAHGWVVAFTHRFTVILVTRRRHYTVHLVTAVTLPRLHTPLVAAHTPPPRLV